MKNPTSLISRRGLLKGTAALSAGVILPEIVPRHCVAGSGLLAPSETINVAGIGIGGMGGNDIRSAAYAGARIATLCDVDTGKKISGKTRRGSQ